MTDDGIPNIGLTHKRRIVSAKQLSTAAYFSQLLLAVHLLQLLSQCASTFSVWLLRVDCRKLESVSLLTTSGSGGGAIN